MPENYISTRFKLEAEIGGIKFDDVVSISATFGLNSIPTASLTVACGREVKTGKLATIHEAIRQLKPRQPAKVWLTITSAGGKKQKPIIDGMEDGRYVIFEGYYAGIGYQRSHASAAYTINLLHWLDDLNCSTMLNGFWMPGAPHDLATGAGMHAVITDSSGQQKYVNLAPKFGLKGEGNFITPDRLQNDFWGETVKPIFKQVSEWPHVNNCAAGTAGGGNTSTAPTNKRAQSALEKMPGKAPTPAKLPLLGVDGSDMWVQMVDKGLSQMVLNGIGYSTFWSTLIGEIGAAFFCAVSPGVEYANVIPFFAGLRKEWRTITGEEYNYATMNTNASIMYQSVNIFFRPTNSSGAAQGEPAARTLGYCRPWGRFPENPKTDGQIIIRDAPPWLTNAAPGGLYTQVCVLPPCGDTHVNQTGKGPTGNVPRDGNDGERRVGSGGILDKIAKQWFQTTVLAQRTGELSGKLRFDIAPGSIVKIEAPASALGQEKEDFFAAVTQVSYLIDAERHVAGTSFGFHSLRTEEENKNDDLTSDTPPLYRDPWSGGPLAIPE